MDEGESLELHAARLLIGLAKELPDFQLISHSEVQFAEFPGRMLRFTFSGRFTPLEQTIALVERETEAGRIAARFAFTCDRDVAMSAQPFFASIMNSIRVDPPKDQSNTPRSDA